MNRTEQRRASEHQKRFIATGGRWEALYLSIYQMHTALVTAIRMVSSALPLSLPFVAGALDCAFVYKLIKLKVSG